MQIFWLFISLGAFLALYSKTINAASSREEKKKKGHLTPVSIASLLLINIGILGLLVSAFFQ